MGRPKKFKDPNNVSVTFEREEHSDLRLVAAQQNKSVSEFLRDLTLTVLRRKPPEENYQTYMPEE